MLKHVQISPLRNRADSMSLRSSVSSCASSMCGSPEPPTDLQRTPSRASSYSSLSEQLPLPQTTIKVYTSCLKIDIEYKTLGIQWDTTSKEVIAQLLRRLKMRHRDPRLFYLSMEVSVRRAGVKTILVLDDDTRPAILQACHPKGESRFCLQLKPGGLIRVHTSALQANAQYKSLIISDETTSDELLQLLLSCYNSSEPVEQFSIYEVCPGQEYQRKLHPDDIPLRAQNERMKRGETCHFLVRRNPNFAVRRRQLLSSLNDAVYATDSSKRSYNEDANSTISSLDEASLLDMSIESISDDLQSLMTTSSEDEDSASSTSGSSDTSSDSSTSAGRASMSSLSLLPRKQQQSNEICLNCHNKFRSCEFCHKNPSKEQKQQLHRQFSMKQPQQHITSNKMQLPAYSPVYNIREIRTVSHSFSSLGKDKKLLDIQLNGRFDPTTNITTYRLRPQSVYMTTGQVSRPSLLSSQDRMIMDANADGNKSSSVSANASNNSADINGNTDVAVALSSTVATTTATSPYAREMVNNNPSRGLGHYVYL